MSDGDDDLGTVRWFGESWGAPICDPRAHMSVPLGERCLECKVDFEHGDQGVATLASFEIAESCQVFYHLDCFLRMLGISISVPLVIEVDDE